MRWLALGLAAFAAYWAPKVRGGKGGADGEWWSGWGRYLVGGLEHSFFPFSWEWNKNPNWRTHIFQRGRYTTNQILYVYWFVSILYYDLFIYIIHVYIYIIVYFYDNIYIYMYTCGDGSKPGRYHSFGDWTSYEPVNMDTHSWNGTYMGIVQAVGCKVRFKAFIYWFIFDYIESSTCFVDCWMFNSGSWNYLKGRWTIPFV